MRKWLLAALFPVAFGRSRPRCTNTNPARKAQQQSRVTRMRLLFVLTTATLPIFAVPTWGQTQSARIEGFRIFTELQACTRGAKNFPGMDLIRAHVPDSPAQPTLDQLIDETLVSTEEAAAWREFHAAVEKCRQQALTQMIEVVPGIATILSTGYARGDDYLTDLLLKKITWGEYARRSRDLDSEVRRQLVAEDQREASGVQRVQEADAAERARRASELADIFKNIQIPPPPVIRPPIMTNCQQMGATINCMTQ
jgi:hypothetical protein